MGHSDELLTTTLLALWDRFSQYCASLDAQDLRRPTRLGDWTVHELLAHHAPQGYARVLGSAAPGEPDVERAADVLRAWHRPDGLARELAPRIAEAAHRAAHDTGLDELAARFETSKPVITSAMARPDDVVDYFGAGLLQVREVVRLGILESTVHLLDLLDALGSAPQLPAHAARITKHLLADAAPDAHLIDAATGRRADAPFPVMA